ncbi:F-box domain-containing protein [Decorospora gaudefroyi]|uniref:F-box domain-containing protein n=1 Tax=Decorospora gaudefroyi TaxID=184978 RepID=A0A6A5KEI1_9PLEO|nr:F-box domain-containing protein [Decorospora gaudefroyi]
MLILRILHNRLVAAAKLPSYTVLFECFHPSAKLTEEPYHCSYRGTDGLTLYQEPECDKKENVGRLRDMFNMYSRFRPHRRELEPGGRKVRPRPGDIPGSRTFPGTVQERYQGDIITQTVGLEAHEWFTQLVVQTHLVKIGSRGMYTSFVEIEDGVLRVWRNWLRDIAAKGPTVNSDVLREVVQEAGKGKGAVRQAVEEEEEEVDLEDPRIIWVTPRRDSGIRFKVKERKLRRGAPILISADEDMPVSYEVEFDELIIRTSYLLLKLEQSMVQEDNSGKAVVFGSFG